MAKVKVKTGNCIIDGHKPGSTISIEEKSANYYESIGYVERIGAAKEDKKEDNK